ncbi:hypothetical protein [Isoptericola variabilis]|uniref:Peptidase M1 membrane alanine aminopeptidase n=1 Tax=Isoptericola variabilis (strain 225) TaxID=743718 RepID=F6FV59_ISOV2|nr:hypothetical protein [Isoptericola variabilis]AEG45487.1 hypothetical protein Isova_2798 [Isoptericola variabilis 225]
MRRAVAGLLGAGVLGATLVAGPVATADEGLAEASHSRFVLDTADTVVEASVTVTIRNVTVDRHTAEGTYYSYYDSYGIPVPAGAKDVRAVSGGATLPVRLAPTEDPSTAVATASFSPLRSGQTRTIEWTYTIPGAPIRSEDYTRVGPGYLTFAAQGVGDPGEVTVEVVLPAAMSFDATSDVFTPARDGDTVTYTADESTEDGGIWAVVSARDAGAADEQQVEVGDVMLTLQSFPGDTEWLRFVGERVTTGLPVLEDVVGHPWPGGLETIREDVSPQVLGYAWFDHGADEIVIAEDLDDVVLFHELTHAWLNPDRLAGRWLYEGLTEVVAHRVVAATGGSGEPRGTPERDAPGALPLLEWEEFDGARVPEVEDYAYAASYTAVRELLGDLDDEAFTAVVAAAYAGESAYEEPGSTTANRGRTDWRRFLDLAEERAGVTDGTDVYRTWVVDDAARDQLDRRAEARQTYAALDGADGAWQPPLGLRRAMTDWEFDSAATIVGQELGTAPAEAARVQEAAEAAGLPVPEPVRAAYETAEADEEYGALQTLLPRAVEVIGAVGEAARATSGDRDALSALGAVLLRVDRSAADAREALADGELERAAALADTASQRAGWALWAGLGAVVLVVLLLAGAVLGVVRVGRRRRAVRVTPPAPAAGPATSAEPTPPADGYALSPESAQNGDKL